MPIVLNTSSLSTLHRTRCLQVLQSLFQGQRIVVPRAVIGEFSAKFMCPSFVEQIDLDPRQRATADTITGLAAGEREAIALARETSSLLIVDDRKARSKAKEMGISIVGSLGVIKQAFVDCHIFEDERNRFIQEGRSFSYWPDEIVEDVIRSRKPGSAHEEYSL